MPRQALSKGEMDVARVLWEVGPAGVRTVHECLCKQREIDFATVQTYLRRLETKGYATSKLKGRARVYSAKAKAKTVIRETVDDLIDRLFGGDSLPLVRHLIEERGIDADGLDELRCLIDAMDQQKDSEENK